jgi:hypothetical protein
MMAFYSGIEIERRFGISQCCFLQIALKAKFALDNLFAQKLQIINKSKSKN